MFRNSIDIKTLVISYYVPDGLVGDIEPAEEAMEDAPPYRMVEDPRHAHGNRCAY
jgi:hypothetical protein